MNDFVIPGLILMCIWFLVQVVIISANWEAMKQIAKNQVLQDQLIDLKRDYNQLRDYFSKVEQEFCNYRYDHPCNENCEHAEDYDDDDDEEETDFFSDPFGLLDFSDN